MAPSGETDFITQVSKVTSCKHREGGDGWTGTAEMWRFLVELLDEHIRDLSGTPFSSENALAYCLQAIAETDEKVGIMKSHIAKMEEEINIVPILRNELLSNDIESNNGEIDNFSL
jgi:hypothetical protein